MGGNDKEIFMPVRTSIPLSPCSQTAFGDIAYDVVGVALDLYAKMGNKFQESVYRSTLRQSLGIRASEEIEINLIHQNFMKKLYMDLVVDSSCVFELKASKSISPSHTSQLIQYLMLTGLNHGKVISFGGAQIEHKFVNCHMSVDDRREFTFERIGWADRSCCRSIEQIVVSLIQDWGTGLTAPLYLEAMVRLAKLADKNINTFWDVKVTGKQPVHLIEPNHSFEVTCLTERIESYKSNLVRFLRHTALDAILWVNITNGNVRLEKIVKE